LAARKYFIYYILLPGSTGLFLGFLGAPRAPGMGPIKKLHKTNSSSFEVPVNFAFMHQARIPTFYSANLDPQGSFQGFSGAPRAPGVGPIKKLHKIYSSYFEVPINFSFMHQDRIPTFYLANHRAFPGLFVGPQGPRGGSNPKVA
jgi:hypothetical protein